MADPLAPNAWIGIVGGGQLGRMLAASAAKLGYRIAILDPDDQAPASQLANRFIVAAYDDETALEELSRLCDVVTYEFENVPVAAVDRLEKAVPVFPPRLALEVAQDRVREKAFIEAQGVPVAPFVAIADAADLVAASSTLGDGILKTRRFGYDGKGQTGLPANASLEQAEAALDALGNPETGCVLEQKIAFELEFSIIAIRDRSGTVALFDPSVNTHEDGILRRSRVPAGLNEPTLKAAADAARRIADALDYVGALGIEFFATADGILVNEIAPRVHNTGHWTVEACACSQFDQHIRAVAGLPLGSTSRLADCEMINLLGDEIDGVPELLADPEIQVTLYGKREPRSGRKMGHYTRLISPV